MPQGRHRPRMRCRPPRVPRRSRQGHSPSWSPVFSYRRGSGSDEPPRAPEIHRECCIALGVGRLTCIRPRAEGDALWRFDTKDRASADVVPPRADSRPVLESRLPSEDGGTSRGESRRPRGPAEDVMNLVAMLPWWAGVLFAALAYFALHHVASQPMAATVTQTLWRTLASMGRGHSHQVQLSVALPTVGAGGRSTRPRPSAAAQRIEMQAAADIADLGLQSSVPGT